MKNQYFADARDYFKYDALERILVTDHAVEQITCIWMLTRPDLTGQGRVPFVPDPELPELTRFFQERLEADRRRVSEMPAYLSRHGHRVFSYRDDREDFSFWTRAKYFAEIPDNALRHSVVFFDPDVGLEPGHPTEKHLLFAELEEVFQRMDESSTAVIFQYSRREAGFWDSMAVQLRDRLATDVLFIADSAVGVLRHST